MKPYEEFELDLLSATTAQQLANVINEFHNAGGGFHVWIAPFFLQHRLDIFIKDIIIINDKFYNKLDTIVVKLPENIISNIEKEYGNWISVYGSYKGFIIFTTNTVPPIVAKIISVSKYT